MKIKSDHVVMVVGEIRKSGDLNIGKIVELDGVKYQLHECEDYNSPDTCSGCVAKGNLQMCTKLPRCYTSDLSKIGYFKPLNKEEQ